MYFASIDNVILLLDFMLLLEDVTQKAQGMKF